MLSMSSGQKEGSEFYLAGRRLVEAGKLTEAYELVHGIVRRQSGSLRAWADGGMLLYLMGRCEEAERYLLRAMELGACEPDVLSCLVRVYLAQGKADRAFRWIGEPTAAGGADEGLVCQTAELFMRKGDLAGAMEAVCRGIHFGAGRGLEELMERIRGGRAKIAFFCGGDGDAFLKEILSYAQQRYQVRVFEGTTSREMHELMRWSDISWFEWCTALARVGTNLPKVCRNIIRLHRYEAYLSWPKEICWENADLLITVGNSFVLDALRRWLPDIERRVAIATIPNGVNLERVPFRRRTAGKNLAFVASLRMVKNPMLLLACMAGLHSAAPEYKLFIAGKFPDMLIEQYFWHQVKALGLEGAVVFDGWQEDIAGWLEDKHYIVSTSVIESQGMGILEAMAAGLKPVIHNFPGAEEIFSGQFLFNSPDEFCRQILSEDYDSVRYREFVERRYPLERQLMQINEVFARFEQQHPDGREQGIKGQTPAACGTG